MKYRQVLVFSAIAVICVIAAFAADDPVGEPGSSSQRALRLAQPSRDDAPTPIPKPIPGSPVAEMNVNVLNLPLDEGGHIVMCDHTDMPRKVEITNRDWRFELVGFTSATALPDVGVFGMSRLCGEEFEASRMCTIGEALGTVAPPILDATPLDLAWVRDDAALGGPPANTAPGARRQKVWCDGWSSTNGVGLVVTVEGAVATAPCDEVARIACCAPVR